MPCAFRERNKKEREKESWNKIESLKLGERKTRLDGGEEETVASRRCSPKNMAAPPLRENARERREGRKVSFSLLL